MTLNKSLTAKLSGMTHSYYANILSVSTLDGRDADTAVCKKKKTVETGCMWILMIPAADPTDDKPMGGYYYYCYSIDHSVFFYRSFDIFYLSIKRMPMTNSAQTSFLASHRTFALTESTLT